LIAFTGEKLRKENLCWALSLMIFLLLLTLPVQRVYAVREKPAYIYLTWATSDMAHTINVSWRTYEAEYVGEVLYDVEPHHGDPEAYAYHAEGDPTITPVTLKGTGGYFHHVELTGLKPDTKYYFICGHPDYWYSDEHSFRTAPVDPENIRFVVGGDSRSNEGIGSPNPDWPGARDRITQLAASCNPDFINFNGDFISSGEEQYGKDTWDNWLGAWYEYARAEDGSLIPIVPAIGNHEIIYPQPADYDPISQASNYYAVFNLPRNERWYSLDWGPDLHIVVLDSEIKSTESDSWNDQLEWLMQDLLQHRDNLWKIAAFHTPAFSSGKYGPDINIQRDWVPEFDLYHVDLCFSGHDHNYQRTYPINFYLSEENYQPSPENGTIYVVSAGWGAPLYSGSGRLGWWTAYGPDPKYHFTLVNVYENGTFHLQAVGTDGKTFDEYSIYKEVPAPEGGLPIVAIVISIVVIACAGVAFYLLRIRGKS